MRSRIRRLSKAGSRVGVPVSTASRATWPSLRNNVTSNRRPPSPRSPSTTAASPANCSITTSTSFVRATGSGKLRSTRITGGTRRGVMCGSSSSNNRASFKVQALPKRVVSGWRGRAARSAMLRNPARRSAWWVFASISSASTGRSPIALTAKRAFARALSGVAPSAVRAVKPRCRKRFCRSVASAASLPNICAQPVISRIKPCGRSTAQPGVYRSQPSASHSNRSSSA